MRTSKDFVKIKNDKVIDRFIEESVYTQFDEGTYPAKIYINEIQLAELNPKILKNRLKELGFAVVDTKEGVDSVLEIRIK